MLLFLPACGCDKNEPASSDSGLAPSSAVPDQPATLSEASTEVAKSADTDLPEEITLTLGNEDTFRELLNQHKGKVVLVDFWATWCVPCLQQFPHTVSLSGKHRDVGLAVISVSMNEPDEKESVQRFLTKSKAAFDNLLTDYGAGAEFLVAFDLRGEVPFYKLYDRQGSLRYSFSGDPAGLENCEPIERIDERVAQLLSE